RAWRSGWTAAAAAAERRWSRLVPTVEVAAEALALRAHHAEAVPGRGFHHPPALDEGDLARAQALQPVGFGVDVVALDVQVHARFVLDLLQQDDRLVLVLVRGEHAVAAIAILVRSGDRLA